MEDNCQQQQQQQQQNKIDIKDSLLNNDLKNTSKNLKRQKKIKRLINILFGLSIILVVIGIFIPMILDAILNLVCRKMVIMSPENQQLWAQVPGETNMLINRTYYFYNFTNSDAFLFNGSKPELIKVGPFKYQEFQNFTNIQFDKQQQEFKYNFWNYMHRLDPQDDRQQKIHILNMFPLVAFDQIRQAPKHMIVLQALGNLIIQLEQQTIIQAVAQAIYQLNLNDETQKENYIKYIRNKQIVQFIMHDDYIGFNSSQSLQQWILAAQEYKQYKQINKYGLQLKKYFKLEDIELIEIYKEINNNYNMVYDILQNSYCNQLNNKCDDKYFAALQWSQSGLTLNNPLGDSYPSIVYMNSSATGYPELYYYFNYKFLPYIKQNEADQYQRYSDLSFDLDWALNILKHNNDIKNWIKDWDTLLHVGNLQYIFEIGQKYQQQQNKSDLNIFNDLSIRFKMNSLEKSRVLYEYLNYLATDFAVLEYKKGTKEILGIAALSTQGFYKYYSLLKDNLHRNLTNAYMLYNIQKDNITLYNYINKRHQLFYDKYDFNFNQNNIDFYRNLCLKGIYNSQYQDFAKKYDILNGLNYLCDKKNKQSFMYQEVISELQINQFYGCSQQRQYCNDQEIAIQEWISNNITKSIQKEIKEFFIFTNQYESKGVEFNKFLQKYGIYDKVKKDKLYEWGKINMNFNKLLGILNIQKAFVNRTNNLQEHSEKFFQLEMIGIQLDVLLDYMRYLAMQLGLGGFTTDLSVHDMLYGYEISLFKDMRKIDPAMGGNPFQPTGKELGIAQNFSYVQSLNLNYSMQSGKNDIQHLRYYTSQQGKKYINYMDIVFNGNYSKTVYSQGWKNKIMLKGTDGFINRPNIIKNDIKQLEIFVAPLWRNAIVRRKENLQMIDHFGVKSIRFNLARETTQNKQQHKGNAVYYQDKLDGFLNCSQMMKGPMFQSKMNFLHVDPKYVDKVKMFKDVNKSQLIESEENNDESYLDIEPYTGMSIGAWLKLQFNMYFNNSNLLLQKSNKNNDIVIPIIGFIRGADIPKQFADGMLYNLKLAIKMKSILQIVFISIGFTGIFICVSLLLHNKKYQVI